MVGEPSASTVISSQSVVACAGFSRRFIRSCESLIGDADIRQIGGHPGFPECGKLRESIAETLALGVVALAKSDEYGQRYYQDKEVRTS